MRTKTLLLTAVLSAAGIGSSLAQVYSVNAVGYVNKTLPPGYSIVANPLDNKNGNLVPALFPSVPNGTSIYKYDSAGGIFVAINFFFGWSIPTMTLVPGEAAFVNNPTATTVTNTFVGEVAQGGPGTPNPTLSNPIPAGFSLKGSQVPQKGQLDTDLKFPVVNGDTVYRYDNAANSFVAHNYFFGWNIPPTNDVAEGFFVNKVAPTTWTRDFNVNQTP